MQTESQTVRGVKVFLCGDVMLGRGVDQILPCPSDPVLHEPYVQSAREYLEMAERANGRISKPVPFSYVWGDALDAIDLAAPVVRIVNLETSITTSEEYDPKGINYRMHSGNTPCLTAAKIDCCVLANNHILDWGRPGLADTARALRKAGIQIAGAGQNPAEAWEPAIIQVDGHARVIVVAAGTPDSGVTRAWAATDSASGVAFLPDLSPTSAARIAEVVGKVKRPGDIAILSIHWGGNWGYNIPREHTRFAHRVIDSGGVDVVHGHSSHHPKGIEVYNGKLILYGCGDFLNDYEGIAGYETFRSHLVLAYFPAIDPATGKLQSLDLLPFEIKRLQLRRTISDDTAWLAELLTREGEPLGTNVKTEAPNRLAVAWKH